MGHWDKGAAVIGTMMLLATAPMAHAASAMGTGGRTTQPIGHYDLCKRMPTECQERSASTAAAPYSKKFMQMVAKINSRTNAAVTPKTDQEMWGVEEYWSYPTTVGDCEDYVLAKRRKLIEMGVSPGNVLITVVRQPNGDGHAVLTLRTTGGDFILDNLDNRVLPWQNTPYTYLKRQSEKHSGVWLTINAGGATAVSSVR